jgi:hypothetical protein
MKIGRRRLPQRGRRFLDEDQLDELRDYADYTKSDAQPADAMAFEWRGA